MIAPQRVIELHDAAIARWGGLAGPMNPLPCVDGCLGNAQQAESYQEARRSAKAGLVFISYALYYLALNHCFADGNKRAAWLTATDALAALGLSVEATEDEVVGMIESVISHELKSGDDVADWFAPRLRPLTPF